MTATRPTAEVRPPEAPPRPRRLVVVLGLVALIVVLAAAGVTLWLTWGSEKPGIDDYVAAVNSGDYDRVGSLLEESGGWADHAQWLIATEADLEARECSVVSEAIEPVPITYERCTIGFGDSWFYNRAGLGDATTTLQVSVTDGVLRVVDFPAPEGLTGVEHQFRV